MSQEEDRPPPREFSRIVSVARLGDEPASYRFAASATECRALAQRFGLLSLDRFEFAARLSRAAGAGIRLDAHIEAELVQECVVTLEPLPNRVEEAFALLYRRDPPVSEVIEPGEIDIEALENDEIDLGEAAAQQLALALDPYPRAPGAELRASVEEGEFSPHPFAGLAKLRKG